MKIKIPSTAENSKILVQFNAAKRGNEKIHQVILTTAKILRTH